MNELIAYKEIINQIFFIRGKKVMIDSDLAMLYDVDTKVLNQTVKRNKLAARSLVILGTILASTAIWTTVVNSIKPSSRTSAPLSDISSSVTPPGINNSDVTATVQPGVPPQTNIPSQTTTKQQTVPRLRTRGS